MRPRPVDASRAGCPRWQLSAALDRDVPLTALRQYGRVRIGVALMLALALASAAHAGAPRLVGTLACPDARGFVCSTLVVPLDHHGRVSGSLGLPVAATSNVRAPRGVLMFLTGGPGQPGVPFATRVAQRLAPLLADYRLVLLDQRGTGAGRSIARRCSGRWVPPT
jgi:hypothetical protein